LKRLPVNGDRGTGRQETGLWRLVIEPKPRPRHTPAELLAASDHTQPQPDEERKWVDAPAVGREVT